MAAAKARWWPGDGPTGVAAKAGARRGGDEPGPFYPDYWLGWGSSHDTLGFAPT